MLHMEKGMATHSSILAWSIPWTEKPWGLQSTVSQRVRHTWSDLACMHACYTCKTLKINKEPTSPMLSTSLTSFFPVCCYIDKNAKNLDFWNPTEFKSHYHSLSHDNVLLEVILSALCYIFQFCIWDCCGHLNLHGSKKKKACIKGLQSSQKIAASTNSNLISFS